MSVNTMGIEQAMTILSAIVGQMQGTQPAEVNVGNFTSVANNVLRTGYDPLNTAISQVLARSIYSNRPYKGKLGGLRVDSQKYGAITRKINFIDGALENDQQLYKTGSTVYADGDVPAPDQYAIRKPKVWQSNFYGAETFQRVTTRWKNQLDTAMSGPREFAEFISAQYQNVDDQLEQVHEAQRRQALINFIGGKYVLSTTDTAGTHVLHLFTMYNDMVNPTTDISISNYMQPDYFKDFVEWFYGILQTYISFMSERNSIYHYNPKGIGNIQRHTPANRMKAYMNTGFFNQVQSKVLSAVFNRDELKMVDFEGVNYWQSIENPTSIIAKVSVNDPAVSLQTGSSNDLKDYQVTTEVASGQQIQMAPILGVLFDEEAVGMTIADHWQMDTNINAATGHTNTFWHFTDKIWNDFSENGLVLALD